LVEHARARQCAGDQELLASQMIEL
jgi:hypothetical protein